MRNASAVFSTVEDVLLSATSELPHDEGGLW
jgi:hypothetical protein